MLLIAAMLLLLRSVPSTLFRRNSASTYRSAFSLSRRRQRGPRASLSRSFGAYFSCHTTPPHHKTTTAHASNAALSRDPRVPSSRQNSFIFTSDGNQKKQRGIVPNQHNHFITRLLSSFSLVIYALFLSPPHPSSPPLYRFSLYSLAFGGKPPYTGKRAAWWSCGRKGIVLWPIPPSTPMF
jgi:hypothetical protein